MDTGSDQSVGGLLQAGIAAARSGQDVQARALLMRVVESDEENTLAWLWLSGVVDSLADREICLENVLTLDPNHAAARKGLAWVRKQMAQATLPAEVTAPPTPLPEEEVSSEVSPPPVATAAPETPPAVGKDELSGEHLCPYCASQTRYDDRTCPACGGALWIKVRRRDKRSIWLWNIVAVEMSMTVLSVVALLLLLTAAAYVVLGAYDPFPLVPVYLGLPGNVSPEVESAVLERIPRIYLLPLVALFLYSLVSVVTVYLCWPPAFYLLLGGVAVQLAASVAGMILGGDYGLLCGGSGIVFSIASVFVVLQLQDDFFHDKRRLLFQIDRRAGRGLGPFLRGRQYAEQKMWALAALHFRQALVQMPTERRMDGYVQLAIAYIRFKRYDLAERALADARAFDPNDARLADLATLLADQRPANVHL
jgi:tetratricopeptide (TPR) repeat protein